MNQRQIGIIIIIVGVLAAASVLVFKIQDDALVNAVIVSQGGSCYLDDGTCLHKDRPFWPYILGGAVAAGLVLLGLYLALFDRTQETLAKQHVQVATALKEAKQRETGKEKFEAFLSGFSDDERSVLGAVHEQDGITQATLRYRIGMSKTALSMVLKELELKNAVSRKPKGKTNEVFLRQKF
ncbi:MAG: MarR family transcriptional regulator [archaeon]